MAHARQDGHRPQASGHQEQPVERQDQQRRFGAQAHAADQEQRQPAGDRPFVAELNEQQQREQHRARAAEILQRLPQGGLCAVRAGAGIGAPAVDRRKNRRHHRHEDQDAGHGVGVEGAGHQQGGGRQPNPYQMPPRLTVPPPRPGSWAKWHGTGHIEQAGGNAEHQEAGHPPPGGKRRRYQRQVDQRDAGQGAGEHQQKRKAAPLAGSAAPALPRPRFRPPGSGSNCRRP